MQDSLTDSICAGDPDQSFWFSRVGARVTVPVADESDPGDHSPT
jgi:hypothetical protein